ncbi:MAG TPA: pilin [Candidatus Paceibacterota bacterium]|nr:pilin [Candidatus Paceibacterota bacterium]
MQPLRKFASNALAAAALFAAAANIAVAQSITLPNPIGTTSWADVAGKIVNVIFVDIAIPLCTIMALVGGFQLMTSAGEPEKASRGRKTLLYAALGFGVVLCATGIASLLQNLLTP